MTSASKAVRQSTILKEIMKPERWGQIERLYHDALDLPPGERTAFLDEACGDDQDLRREVESLLDCDERAQDFIATPPDTIAAELMAAAQAPSLVGGSLNHYRVLSTLGRGGMGEVYLATDTRLGRKVAVKLLHSEFMRDADRVRRFEQEARAASALNHPNILTIHEISEVSTNSGVAHYIVSEFVEGQTLRTMMRAGGLGVSQAIGIVNQVAGALAVAHEAGIVHRDIKPENVMVRADGLVKILDFGLAKLTEQSAAPPEVNSQAETMAHLSTEPGVVMGTVSYMSPEQARGLKVDHRTDIFSLGVTLYEMVTGRRPFEGATMSDVIAALLTAEPLALRSIEPNAPARMERITQKCLAKDYKARYQSAGELLSDLKKIEQELKSGTDAAAVKSRRFDITTPARRTMLITAIAILAAAALVYWLLFLNKPAVRRQSLAEVKTLAVLPLKSLSREAGDDYMGLGLADAIITRTSQMKTLVVRPISAVHGYHNQKVDPLEVARELQVDAVLDGSVQRAGDHLRVNLNLLRAQDGVSLWADSFDREMKNVFALQDDISSNVVKALKLTVTAGEEKQFAGPPTKIAEAYDYYWRGRYYLAKDDRVNFETAVTMFERSTALDPSFALAHADLALACSAIFFGRSDKKYEEKAYVALQKALALDPTLARAYVTRANLTWTLANGFPHEPAIKDHRRAIAIDPNLAVAHRILGALIVHLGLLDQALAELQTALRLEPNDRGSPPRIARIYLFQQKYELALAEFQKAKDPNFDWERGLTLWHMGRKDEAFALLEKRLGESSDGRNGYDLHAAYTVLLADAGRRREAEEHIRLAIEGGHGSSHFHHAEFNIACAYALMGRKQKAMEWLENTAEHGMPCYPLFNTEPALNSLRGDPQFRAFMERMKKQWEVYLRDFG
ncbi:MAG TPA: protein kinase [Blastocatellia bacterium]|nr:protein kinase [Blastocatellia bacterium]